MTFSSTPSRFDHSPISIRDHERAYFVLEIQMARHFFFFATKGLLGAIDPIDGGTKELRNEPSPSHFWFIKIGWIAAHLHFFHSQPRKLLLSSLRAQERTSLFYAWSLYKNTQNPSRGTHRRGSTPVILGETMTGLDLSWSLLL